MSHLIFNDATYILKRNRLANPLFILFVLYSLFYYYTNYPSILNERTTLLNSDPITFIVTSIIIIFFDSVLTLLIISMYFFSSYFEFDSNSNELMTYRYFILWKYHIKIIELHNYKDIAYQNGRSSKTLYLDPKDDTQKKVYLTEVSYKSLNTDIWQSFLNNLKRTF